MSSVSGRDPGTPCQPPTCCDCPYTGFSLFVGDLPPEVHDHFLESFFRQYFPSVRSAKVHTKGGRGGVAC